MHGRRGAKGERVGRTDHVATHVRDSVRQEVDLGSHRGLANYLSILPIRVHHGDAHRLQRVLPVLGRGDDGDWREDARVRLCVLVQTFVEFELVYARVRIVGVRRALGHVTVDQQLYCTGALAHLHHDLGRARLHRGRARTSEGRPYVLVRRLSLAEREDVSLGGRALQAVVDRGGLKLAEEHVTRVFPRFTRTATVVVASHCF